MGKTFDEYDPPDSYKKFRKQVMQTVEEAEVEEDDEFDCALFMVNRVPEGKILYIEDILPDEEEQETLSISFLLETVFPHIIKKNNSKFFAFVMPAMKNSETGEPHEIVLLLSGSVGATDLFSAEATVEDGYYELEPWQKEDVMQYSDLVVPFRRAIVLEG
jgi:hypothetical protein